MKIKQYAAFALMGLALGACNKPGGEDPDVVEPEGELVTAKLAISIPKSIRTYAPGGADSYATGDEITANRIDVFVYENGGSYAVQHFPFTTNVGSPTTPDPLTQEFGIDENSTPTDESDDVFITSTFNVREGNKLVYVGINLPALIRDRLATGYYVNEIYEDPDLLSQLIIPNATANGSAVVPYFSSSRDANVKFDAVTDAMATKELSVMVNKLVAKIVVRTDGGAASTEFDEVSGGTITNFQFAIGQINNQMFVAPLRGLFGSDPLTDPGKDPNHDGSTTNSIGAASPQGVTLLQPVDEVNDYIAVNDLITDYTDINNFVHYTTENTSDQHRHQDVTYVSVKAQFIPHKLGGDPLTGDAGADYTAGVPVSTNELYAVFTGDGSGEGSDALGARYFDNLAEARAFVTGTYFAGTIAGHAIVANTGGYDENAIQGSSDHYIFFYDNSWCYYRIYLNPNGLATTGGTPGETNPYDILRNTVYIATINGVNYIGTTNPGAIPGGYEDGTLATVAPNEERGTPVYPGDWFPNPLASAPIMPDDVIEATTFANGLNVSIDMEDWYEHDDNYVLD